MGMERQAAAIRAEVFALGDRRGRGKAYPEELRRRAVAYFVACRAEGMAITEIGAHLGIPWQTLQKWASVADATLVTTNGAGFERVEVMDTSSSTQRGRVVVHGPRGLCIEGLDVDMLAELIRRLS